MSSLFRWAERFCCFTTHTNVGQRRLGGPPRKTLTQVGQAIIVFEVVGVLVPLEADIIGDQVVSPDDVFAILESVLLAATVLVEFVVC